MTSSFKSWTLATGFGLILPWIAQGAEPVAVKVIAENFDNPSGVAVQPETGDIFVATHLGVMRVFRDSENKQLGCNFEVARYPSDVYGKGPKYEIGPLGLAMIGSGQLVVGDGSRIDGEELIRIYAVGDKPLATPQSEPWAAQTLGPIPAGEASAKGEGNFYGVVATKNAIYATANGDDTKGWVVRSLIQDGQFGTLEPFIATKTAVHVDAPCGITVNQAGDLVISQMGEISAPGDSLLTIYDSQSGKLKHSYTTGLNDIIGIAYSPDGRLFGVDFSWVNPSQGGLYELTIADDKCTARKILDLDKPTSLTFDAEGSLLVTLFGTAEEGSEQKPGKLIRIQQTDLKPAR
ncbi:hypothetical protein SH661x_000911 [Planctomicrobium sp. SH661]|uniref:hypothetical protein n=1 Tax=Planctomicrobium sp. SH661 TaxID=3448124 RepID=UPI003F5BF9A2